MKKILQIILKFLTKAVLAKYKPKIVGITGSIGKTSAKDAIDCVLAKKFTCRKSVKNYNNEIGLPLAVIGAESPGASISGWLGIIIKFLSLLTVTDKSFPQFLVLEFGADHPGDLAYLASIIKCDVAAITMIAPVHLEYFGSLEQVVKEKTVLVRNLKSGGVLILNNDDEKVRSMAKFKPFKNIKLFSYGFNETSLVRARELALNYEANGVNGIRFKLSYGGSTVPVFLPRIISKAGVYAALAGTAAGLAQGLNLVEISQALLAYSSPKGRMNLISGVKHTLIIDDTYNSSPASSLEALEVLASLPVSEKNNKFAVLGDMLELGGFTEQGHKEVGLAVVKNKLNKLIIVGDRARFIARGAEEAGLSENDIFHFADAAAAGKFIQERMRQGDIILVKGSQGMRMEKAVQEIMAEPDKASELLVRQDAEWLKK